MKIQKAEVGARWIDSLQYSQAGTKAQAVALKAAGIDGVFGYLGVITKDRMFNVLNAGLEFMAVTLASAYDGPSSVKQVQALGLPKGCTVWLDLEGKNAFAMDPKVLIAKINAWADAMIVAGYEPGLYVGSPQPLTSDELQHLHVVRYWNALSRESDRFGALAEPKFGWCVWQMNDSRMWRNTGVWVDINMVGRDFQMRVPTSVAA